MPIKGFPAVTHSIIEAFCCLPRSQANHGRSVTHRPNFKGLQKVPREPLHPILRPYGHYMPLPSGSAPRAVLCDLVRIDTDETSLGMFEAMDTAIPGHADKSDEL